MIEANPVTYDARNPQAPIPVLAARAIAGRPQLAAVRAYSPPAADAEAATAGWQVREEPEDYIPDLLSEEDEDEAVDRELVESVDPHAAGLRDAMALLDDAENLVAVLVTSMENEGDSRAMQADTVLRIVRKKLRKAHVRIDRQDARHRKLFVAYLKLKGQAEEGEE